MIKGAATGTSPEQLVMGFIAYALYISFVVYTPIKQYRRMNKVLKDAEEQNRMEQMITDFQEAVPLCGSRLKAGQNYLFGRNVGTIVRYEEIVRIYGTNTSFHIPPFEVRIQTQDGETNILAIRISRRTHEKDNLKLLAMIYAKNPEVKVGIVD